jgi:hypothetical protein
MSPELCGVSTKALQGSLAMLNHAPPAKPGILRQEKKEVALMWYHSNHLIQTFLESQDKFPQTSKSGPRIFSQNAHGQLVEFQERVAARAVLDLILQVQAVTLPPGQLCLLSGLARSLLPKLEL